MTRGRLGLAIAIGVVALALIAVSGAPAQEREPARDTGSAKGLGLDLQRAERVERLRSVPFGFRNKVNRLVRAHNDLVASHNALVNVVTDCFAVRSVTSYFGYDYQGVANATSALDFTVPGTVADAQMLTFVC
jgi:hypothetical protein